MKRGRAGVVPSGVGACIPSDADYSTQRSALASLVAPHLRSFNYFVDHELRAAVVNIPAIEIDISHKSNSEVLAEQKRQEQLESKSETDAESESEPSGDGSNEERKEVNLLRLQIVDAQIGFPSKSDAEESNSKLYPKDCRQREISYSAPLTVTYEITSLNIHGKENGISDESVNRFTKVIGHVPIMVGSARCHLDMQKTTMNELVSHGEDALEQGGYFISNGIERIIRLLQLPRANYPHAVDRPSFKKRGPEFTSKAVQMRCQSGYLSGKTVTNTLHYLRDGTVVVKFFVKKSEFFIPIVLLLKALKQPMTSDREIYHAIIGNDPDDLEMSSRIELNISQIQNLHFKTTNVNKCREYLGRKFRTMMPEVSDRWSDEQCGCWFLHKYILIHCNELHPFKGNSQQNNGFPLVESQKVGEKKFVCLIEMVRKLFWFVMNKCVDDNPDALSSHDLMVDGAIYGAILNERLEQSLLMFRMLVNKDLRKMQSLAQKTVVENFSDPKYIKNVLSKTGDIGSKLFNFLATGNLSSESGLDMQQVAGYTIVAEKLNRWRYLSHFRSVHRGQFFTEMRTTAVRKLLPESWGFLCPVHTPDGAPCGLLSHLAVQATIITDSTSNAHSVAALINILLSLGMVLQRPKLNSSRDGYRLIMHNGVLLGYATATLLKTTIVPTLRSLVVEALNVPSDKFHVNDFVNPVELVLSSRANGMFASMELCFVDELEFGKGRKTMYPGLFLFSNPGRVVRPVINLKHSKLELIGQTSQLFMNIAAVKHEIEPFHTHCEVAPSAFLSLVATLTPFSDFNQSPRNMYQCQMAKQTMGTPCHNFRFRTDNKLYRINNPQAPLCQTDNQRNFLMDEFPNGTNAVVAVISYTGYDMEDACIINQAGINRGFKHGTIYKSVTVDLSDKQNKYVGNMSLQSVSAFLNSPNQLNNAKAIKSLDWDGLPFVGQRIGYMEPYCAIFDSVEGKVTMEKHKSTEIAVIEEVQILSCSMASNNNYESDVLTPQSILRMMLGIKKVRIKLRYLRIPIVGDKFASRAGQKGVMSVAWPQHDMPFTSTGMTPDLIINPHAFPSRMTIGMLLESMAGKSGALHCKFQDASPFKLGGDEIGNTAVDRFGKELLHAGFNYYGAEQMYSGLFGTPLQVDIYIGVVYYQRLRHMVSDKSQVRSTGPIDPVTRQPVKGRKRHGGVRFGEMERDSLLAHGAAFLTQDRLLNCSDKHIAAVCCGSILSVQRFESSGSEKESNMLDEMDFAPPSNICLKCKICGRTNQWKAIAIPYVLRYLVNELAGMGINWHFDV